MKKLFTLSAVMVFSMSAVFAQSSEKTSVTRATVIKDKESLRLAKPEKSNELKAKVSNQESKRVRADKAMTQSEFNARREELKNKPKKSTKPNQD